MSTAATTATTMDVDAEVKLDQSKLFDDAVEWGNKCYLLHETKGRVGLAVAVMPEDDPAPLSLVVKRHKPSPLHEYYGIVGIEPGSGEFKRIGFVKDWQLKKYKDVVTLKYTIKGFPVLETSSAYNTYAKPLPLPIDRSAATLPEIDSWIKDRYELFLAALKIKKNVPDPTRVSYTKLVELVGKDMTKEILLEGSTSADSLRLCKIDQFSHFFWKALAQWSIKYTEDPEIARPKGPLDISDAITAAETTLHQIRHTFLVRGNRQLMHFLENWHKERNYEFKTEIIEPTDEWKPVFDWYRIEHKPTEFILISFEACLRTLAMRSRYLQDGYCYIPSASYVSSIDSSVIDVRQMPSDDALFAFAEAATELVSDKRFLPNPKFDLRGKICGFNDERPFFYIGRMMISLRAALAQPARTRMGTTRYPQLTTAEEVDRFMRTQTPPCIKKLWVRKEHLKNPQRMELYSVAGWFGISPQAFTAALTPRLEAAYRARGDTSDWIKAKLPKVLSVFKDQQQKGYHSKGCAKRIACEECPISKTLPEEDILRMCACGKEPHRTPEGWIQIRYDPPPSSKPQ